MCFLSKVNIYYWLWKGIFIYAASKFAFTPVPHFFLDHAYSLWPQRKKINRKATLIIKVSVEKRIHEKNKTHFPLNQNSVYMSGNVIFLSRGSLVVFIYIETKRQIYLSASAVFITISSLFADIVVTTFTLFPLHS